MDKKELVRLLALEDFDPIYKEADQIRQRNVGDIVHIRAIIEFSNICRRQCRYCGLNCSNTHVRRYRMSQEEILQTAHRAIDAGYKTIVLQSGEDPGLQLQEMGEIVKEIKQAGAAVTLSLG